MQTEEKRQEEYDLIDQILRGDRDAYRILVDRYSPMVFQLVRRICREEEEATNLAQEIFVRAWEKLESFQHQSAFSTWLYALARNACLDYTKNIRRRNVRMGDMEPYEQENLLQDSRSPEQNLLHKEELELLSEAVRQLPQEYSEPLLMKYRDGYSYEANSERLHV
ncbi:MAG: RNA polymerase sigma factor, partial [Balneolaceae bacterium]